MRLLLSTAALLALSGCELFQAASSGDTGPVADTGASTSGDDTGGEGRDDPNALEGDDAGECSDGLDNDIDGDRDCEDAGCKDDPACAEIDTGRPGDDSGEPGGPGGGPGGDGGGPGGDDTGSGGSPATWAWGWQVAGGNLEIGYWYAFLQGQGEVVPGSSYDMRHWLTVYDDSEAILCSWQYTSVAASPVSGCAACDFAFEQESSDFVEVGGVRCDDLENSLDAWDYGVGHQGGSVDNAWGAGNGVFWYEYAGTWYTSYYSYTTYGG